MGTTEAYQIPWPELGDTPDLPQDFKEVAVATENGLKRIAGGSGAIGAEYTNTVLKGRVDTNEANIAALTTRVTALETRLVRRALGITWQTNWRAISGWVVQQDKWVIGGVNFMSMVDRTVSATGGVTDSNVFRLVNPTGIDCWPRQTQHVGFSSPTTDGDAACGIGVITTAGYFVFEALAFTTATGNKIKANANWRASFAYPIE